MLGDHSVHCWLFVDVSCHGTFVALTFTLITVVG